MTQHSRDTSTKLPDIPEKRYFTIGEVSTLCAVKPHVLRYWEQEFQMLRPCKRRGNRRYYRREDVLVIREIKSLLYEQGYTISGARMQLKSNGSASATPAPAAAPVEQPAEETPAVSQNHNRQLIQELESVLELLA